MYILKTLKHKQYYDENDNYWSKNISLATDFKTQKECQKIIDYVKEMDPYAFKMNPIYIINKKEAYKIYNEEEKITRY